MSTAPRLVDLRTGVPADLPAVAGIMGEAFDPRFGEAWTTAQCLGMLTLPGVWLTLAEQDGFIEGFALSRVVAGDGELLLLAVRPDRRGTGIGTALLRSVVADARARRAERLHLEVRAGNDAVALYTRQGFVAVGRRRNYYRGGHGESFDAETYALSLS